MSVPSFLLHNFTSRTPSTISPGQGSKASQTRQQPSFVPTPPSESVSPSSPLSPLESEDESCRTGFSIPRGQTLMTSYMVPVKPGSSSSGRKRTKSHASTASSLSSCPPQSITQTSPLLPDPFIVPNNPTTANTSPSLIPGLALDPAAGTYFQPGFVISGKGQGQGLEGVYGLEGSLNQVYTGSGHSEGGHSYQVGYPPVTSGAGIGGIQGQGLTPSQVGFNTPAQLHQQVFAYARPSPVGSSSTGVPLTPSTTAGTPSLASQQPLLTTSRLPLNPQHVGYATPSTSSAPYPYHPQQQLGYATSTYAYQQTQYVTPQGYPPVYAGTPNMPYTMIHPAYTTPSGPSYAYHLPPPPPPSAQVLAGPLPYYHHGEYPQSAPSNTGVAYTIGAGHGVYPQGYKPAGSYETPVRPKRGSGSAAKGKAVAVPIVEQVTPVVKASLSLAERTESRRSSVESTPPPLARPIMAQSQPSDRSVTSEGVASTSSHAEISTKKRASPSKQGSVEGGEQQPKRSRGLEIKRSSAEGRRLVFPETPSPETPLLDLEPPRTPPRQIRSRLSPRNREAPGVTQTPNGTASFGVKHILESDLSWLEPVLKPLESPYYSASKRADAVINMTKSERRRRRVEAFRDADDAELTLKTTVLKGYGRLAVKKDTALSFLGVDEQHVELEESAPTLAFTPMMKSRSLPNGLVAGPITPRSTPQSARTSDEQVAVTVPDWPDTSYPWISMVESRKKDSDKMAEVAKLERLSRIQRYLAHVSDDELEESEDQEEQVDLTHPADKTAEPSDAKDAMFNVTRNGLPAFSAGPSGPYLSGVMPTVSGEDESGCLCGGLQQDAGSMVCCGNCSVWFHLSRCGIASEDDLGESWFCWRCEPSQAAGVRTTPTTSEQMGTPTGQPAGHAAYVSTEESIRTYRAYTNDAALAPSPIFLHSNRQPDPEDTPGLMFSRTPRIPSSTSSYRFMTPGTPALPSRMRNTSYAEHYNVCQTPGVTRESDYKIYSTPKFEDLLNDYTPHRGVSPTPGGKARTISRNNPMFTTPSTSQSFLQGLQTGSSSATPGLVHSSSASAQYSPYPASPHSAPPKLHPALSELTASPSPCRSHRRQVSFNRVSFATTASNLRDSVVLEEMKALGKGRPLGLGGALKELGEEEAS